MEIKGQGGAISCKEECITARNQRIVLLAGVDDGSLVIEKLCGEAMEEGTAVTCFCFGFATRNEQLLVNMYSSLLRQPVSGLDGIPKR